jgi:hypothetical protein
MGPHGGDDAGRDGKKKKGIKPLEVARSLSVVVEISITAQDRGRRSMSEMEIFRQLTLVTAVWAKKNAS